MRWLKLYLRDRKAARLLTDEEKREADITYRARKAGSRVLALHIENALPGSKIGDWR